MKEKNVTDEWNSPSRRSRMTGSASKLTGSATKLYTWNGFWFISFCFDRFGKDDQLQSGFVSRIISDSQRMDTRDVWDL